MKNIIVCMKQVLDPEAPLSLFKIDAEAKQAVLPKAVHLVVMQRDMGLIRQLLFQMEAHPRGFAPASFMRNSEALVSALPLRKANTMSLSVK